MKISIAQKEMLVKDRAERVTSYKGEPVWALYGSHQHRTHKALENMDLITEKFTIQPHCRDFFMFTDKGWKVRMELQGRPVDIPNPMVAFKYHYYYEGNDKFNRDNNYHVYSTRGGYVGKFKSKDMIDKGYFTDGKDMGSINDASW